MKKTWGDYAYDDQYEVGSLSIQHLSMEEACRYAESSDSVRLTSATVWQDEEGYIHRVRRERGTAYARRNPKRKKEG
jgi:hypothetical protein